MRIGKDLCFITNHSSITFSDIEFLIKNKVTENLYLEYKRELTLIPPEEKGKFLAAISAFANTLGGDVIIGIEDDKKNQQLNLVGYTAKFSFLENPYYQYSKWFGMPAG